MDLEEWEFLSEDGGLIDHPSPRRRHRSTDGAVRGGRRVISRDDLVPLHPTTGLGTGTGTGTGTIIDMDYFQRFIDPQSSSSKNRYRDNYRNNNHHISPIPVHFHRPEKKIMAPIDGDDGDYDAEPEVVIKEVISTDQVIHRRHSHLLLQRSPPPSLPPPPPPSKSESSVDEVISQIFFKKMGENEFADMKLDSPPTGSKSANRGGLMVPPIDLAAACKQPRFDEETGVFDTDGSGTEGWRTPPPAVGGFAVDNDDDDDEKKKWEIDDDGQNRNCSSNDGAVGGLIGIWKMGMTGIGALCSFGFACATISIIVLGSRSRNQKKRRFQIYTDEQRFRQVVHQAVKLNEAITAVRGGGAPAPATAQITVGGYYFEGL